jgi:hypothetical protein
VCVSARRNGTRHTEPKRANAAGKNLESIMACAFDVWMKTNGRDGAAMCKNENRREAVGLVYAVARKTARVVGSKRICAGGFARAAPCCAACAPQVSAATIAPCVATAVRAEIRRNASTGCS